MGDKKDRCERVVSLVRTPYDFSDEARKEKLTQTIVDFDNLKNFSVPAGITVAFCCLGMRQPSKATKKDFVNVDVGFSETFAKLCKSNGIRHFSLVSAVNAAPKALSRFGRTKYKVEQAVKEPGFEKLSLFRPSILIAMGARYGFRDSMSQNVAPKFTGILSTKYKEVTRATIRYFCLSFLTIFFFLQVRVEDVARAMVTNAELCAGRKGEEVLEWDDFQRLWGMEKYDYDRGRNEELGADH